MALNEEFRRQEALRIEKQRAERVARDAAWQKTLAIKLEKEAEEFRAAEEARKLARLNRLRTAGR